MMQTFVCGKSVKHWKEWTLYECKMIDKVLKMRLCENEDLVLYPCGDSMKVQIDAHDYIHDKNNVFLRKEQAKQIAEYLLKWSEEQDD